MLNQDQTQRGFTLAETIMVVIVIGILSALAASRFTGSSTTGARVLAIMSTADSIAELTRTLNVTLGLPANVSRNAAVNANNDYIDVIVHGEAGLNPAFVEDYLQSGVGTLDNIIRTTTAPVNGSNPGTYEVEEYPITLSSPANNVLQVKYEKVPANVLERLVSDEEGGSFDASVADTAGLVQYDADIDDGVEDGFHTLTIQKTIR